MYPYQTGSKHLYFYTDWTTYAWASDPANWRKLTGRKTSPIRVSHGEIDLPPGYKRTGRSLAHEPIERLPTMKDFIHALSPE
jgi:hypothetical protein